MARSRERSFGTSPPVRYSATASAIAAAGWLPELATGFTLIGRNIANMGARTILTIVDDAAHASTSAAIAAGLPGSIVQRADPALLRQLPPADALIVADAAN